MALPKGIAGLWRVSVGLLFVLAVTAAQKSETGVSGRERLERGRHHRRERLICSMGSYVNKTLGKCHVCSTCPLNQIIRRPCTGHRDTVCGPFYEFQNFHNSASVGQDTVPQKGHSAGDKGRSEGPGHGGTLQSSTISAGGRDGYRADSESLDGEDKPQDFTDTHVADGHTKDPTIQSSAERWRELCFGLIGALATVTFLALIYVIITQISARRQIRKHAADVECRTVLYPTTRVFANGFLSTTDYHKITPQFDDECKKRGPRHWLLRHLRGPHKTSQPNHYIVSDAGDVSIPLHVIPEAVEMDQLQGAPPQLGEAAWPQGSTQSTDSGISS